MNLSASDFTFMHFYLFLILVQVPRLSFGTNTKTIMFSTPDIWYRQIFIIRPQGELYIIYCELLGELSM